MDSRANSVNKPKVSVIVAAYGQEKYLADTLDSLLAQSFQDWEAIVADDGSPDNVRIVAENYAEKDPRIKFLHSENRGAAGVRNLAVSHSNGEYVMMLDGDDYIDRDYLEKCVKILEKDHGVKVVFGNLATFGSQNYIDKVTYHSYPALLINNPLFISGMMRKKDFERIGGFDEYFRTGLEDWEFWIRFLETEKKEAVKILSDTLFHYRKKEMSITVNLDRQRSLMEDYRRRIFEKNKDIYQKYFGEEIRDWMLMERVFIVEERFLLLPEYMEEDLKSGKLNKELINTIMRIGADETLADTEKLILLQGIRKRQSEVLKNNHYTGLSLKKRFRWNLLCKSPELFLQYAKWKKKK